MNFHQAERLWRAPSTEAFGAALLLTAGGDERIRSDPATGRNRYGVMATPRPDEIFLSSSTASSITPRAYRAVEAAWDALAGDRGGHAGLESWFDSLRARLNTLFGIPGGEVVLTASGTEAELVALTVARGILAGPIANIVVAPAETGSGVLRAAAGRHFLNSTPFGPGGRAGAPLGGWEDERIEVVAVEIRDADGRMREAAAIDGEARGRAEAALAAGRDVVLHRLETSKTGQSGVSEDAAGAIAAGAPERVVVLVDCCQLRCSRRRIRRYLARGFMVAVTGSKFFGGPPFSGALLLPPAILARIGRLTPPAGLSDYASRLDWPEALRARMSLAWANDANLGLGLRWVAALEEMERYYATPDALRRDVMSHFAHYVRECAQGIGQLREVGDCRGMSGAPDSILSFVMNHPDGAPYSHAETAAIHARLRAPGRIVHLGQPVAIGSQTALRVCASAPLISGAAERAFTRENIEIADAQWVNGVDAVFEKWRRLMAEDAAGR
jgi:hypothetical protein